MSGEEARDIDPVIGERARHRFSDISESGKMDDGAGVSMSLEGRIEHGEVQDIVFNERPQRTKSAWPLDRSCKCDR